MSTITIGGEVLTELESGRSILIGIVFYVPKDDALRVDFPDSVNREEAKAILKKFGIVIQDPKE